MANTSAERPLKPNAEEWAKISRTWGSNGGESLAALSASFQHTPKQAAGPASIKAETPIGKKN